MPRDIILHKCTKNHDHLLYWSWDMVCDRCSYFLFWATFFFLIGIHSMQDWTATTRHAVTRNEAQKRLQDTEPKVKRCLLILDLKPIRS